MKFHEMVFTIRIDHQVIGNFLDSIARSNYPDARKKLLIFKPLLTNHFLVEQFVFYPFIRKKMLKNASSGHAKLFDTLDSGDEVALVGEMEKQNSVCTQIIAMLAECMRAEETVFRDIFAKAAVLIRERIVFEECHLLKGVDTSKTKLLRKADFVRLRIEE